MNATTAIRIATIAVTATAAYLPVVLSVTGQTAAAPATPGDRGGSIVLALSDDDDSWPWD
jgi:hypothetical protein